MAATITQARARFKGVTPIDEGGYEHEVDEDIDEFFDKDSERIVTGCYGFRTREVSTLPVCTRYYHRDSYQT